MANNKYNKTIRDKVLRLHLEEGQSVKSLMEKYNLGLGTLRYWLDKHCKECEADPIIQNETDKILEIRKLKKELAETKKENDFLK